MEQLEVMLHSTGSILQKLFSKVPERSPQKNVRGERTVGSRSKTRLMSPKFCWLTTSYHLDKKWLQIYQNLIQAL